MGGGSMAGYDIPREEREAAEDNAAADRRERDKAARKRRIAARDRAKASKPKRVERVKT